MKTTSKILVSALALSITSILAYAQDPAPGGRPPGGPGGPGGRPVSPLMAALDTNKDGEIDATEIANASAALKTLDKNGDHEAELSADGVRPPRGRGSSRRRRWAPRTPQARVVPVERELLPPRSRRNSGPFVFLGGGVGAQVASKVAA